ncbi:phosphotransferase enzyme family protein [Actinophytocola sp.]|uniref:phosphotransferase enzyme family protein n=1 Tax=Actinophytocola sp. TaxID=1872138 RepID=UPI003D6B338B
MNLSPWGPVAVVGRLGGGHRNEVLEVWRGCERLVARRSRRSEASLEWELELMGFLGDHGFIVPEVVLTDAGRPQVDGMVVQRWLPGRPPTTSDWPSVATELTRLHELTADYPRRPGFLSTSDLLMAERGGDVDLTAMPPEAVAACRAAWTALEGPHAVVHGDPCAANVRVSEAGIGLLDWDEARVDHPDLDLADLPGVELAEPRGRIARAAVDAWEAAAGWLLEPEYARRRLAALG